MFTLKLKNFITGDEASLLYNPHTSTLYRPDGVECPVPLKEAVFGRAFATSPDNPINKSKDLQTLKIQMGLKCNYSCSYCLQATHVDEQVFMNANDVEPFLEMLDKAINYDKLTRVEFWGGETFVYWKSLQKLVPALKARTQPHAHFNIVTNGSLLDNEKVEWVKKHDISLAISHDGPGQTVTRGPDPLDDPEVFAAIKRLLIERPDKVSFNAVLTRMNCDLSEMREWFKKKFELDYVPLNMEGVVMQHDHNAQTTFWSEEEYTKMRLAVLRQFIEGKELQIHTLRNKIADFMEALEKRRPSYALNQKCGMDRKDFMAVDLKGNVLTCQNVGGESKHNVGHVSDLEGVKLNTAYHWSKREHCNKCPVMQLCKGACMYLDGENFDQTCENEFHFHMAILAGIMFKITGMMLYRVEGDYTRPKLKKRISIPLKVVSAA